MFGKPAIEDFVEFFLGLFLHLGIADHRQEERPKSWSCGICSAWGDAPLAKKKEYQAYKTCALTHIYLSRNIF